MMAHFDVVTPAKAGVQGERTLRLHWIPASAGMTTEVCLELRILAWVPKKRISWRANMTLS